MTTADLRQEHIDFQTTLYESTNPTRRWLHNVRREWVLQTLEHVARDDVNFLEVGIGCGIYTPHMACKGYVLAIDINPDFVAAALDLPNVTAAVADITVDRFRSVHDVALCSEVLEHVTDSRAALANIYASLVPGGHLVLTTPNSYSTVELVARLLSFGPVVKLARAIYGEAVDDLGHINRMTKGQLLKQIREAGFEVVDQTDVAFYLPVVAEFGGAAGARFCQWVARKLAGTRLSGLLWTQCWLLRRPAE